MSHNSFTLDTIQNHPDWGGLNQIANSLRFQVQFSDRLRHNPTLGWLRWDGKILGRVKHPWTEGSYVPDAIRQEAYAEPDSDRRNALLKWATTTTGGDVRREMIRGAEDEVSMLNVDVDDLDANPYLLNTPTGLVDLRTGQVRAAEVTDLVTKLTAVPYDPSAECPLFDRFLSEIVPEEEVRLYLQKAFGYSLTGLTGEECIFIMYGNGQNGKSKLLGAVQYAMGDYATTMNYNTLVASKFEGHPTEIAKLYGRRMAITSETPNTVQFNEARLKMLTGGDKIAARFMRQDEFEFRPTHSLWMATNHLPQIASTDGGIWRRPKVIPFPVTIPPDRRDNRLDEKLRAEAAGILRWCVEGAVEYLKTHQLVMPTTVAMETEAYRGDQSSADNFVESQLVRDDEAIAPLVELHAAYKRWCDLQDVVPGSQKDLVRALTDAGFRNRRLTSGPNKGTQRWDARIDGATALSHSWRF